MATLAEGYLTCTACSHTTENLAHCSQEIQEEAMDRHLAVAHPKFSNGLSDAQRERLDYLVEEIGEVLKAIGKINRHGYESCDPTNAYAAVGDNRRDLEIELGDVLAALNLMKRSGDISETAVYNATQSKIQNIKEGKCYMHHQEVKNG